MHSELMEKTNVYIMCGIPGAGKSTYCQTNLSGVKHISRDDIRVQLGYILPGEKAKLTYEQENKVTKEEYKQIKECINNNVDIVIDDINITKKGRKQLIKYINTFDNTNIIAVNIITPLNICIERRVGQISENVMKEIYSRYCPISESEVSNVINVIYA
jgi:predicted kinase